MEQCSHLGKQQALLLVPQAAEVGSVTALGIKETWFLCQVSVN